MDAQIELRQLRYFATLAAELHFGRAAARIGIAQPALSQQIRQLEQHLGFELFHRTSRRVELSAAGTAWLVSVQRTLAELDRGVESSRNVASGGAGTLTIGFVANSMMTVLPQMVRRFRARHPAVRVVLHESASSTQIDALRAGALDVAFVSDVPDDSGIEQVEVWRDPLVAVTASTFTHPGRRFSIAALAGEPFILFPRAQTPRLYDRLMALCRSHDFEPTVSQEAESWHMIAHLVATGLGVSIAPASIKSYRVPRIRYFALPRSAGSVPLLMCRSAGTTSPTVRAFYDQVRSLG